MYTDIPSFTPSRCSSRKTFNDQSNDEKKYLMRDLMMERDNRQFWEELYNSLFNSYKNLSHKMNLGQQSLELHKEALSLKNQQAVELDNNINSVNHKLMIVNGEVKNHEIRMKQIGQKCHKLKQQSDGIRMKINKQRAIFVEEQKHYEQIWGKIKKIKEETAGLERQMHEQEEKQELYYELCEENEKLKMEFEVKQKQYSLAQLKMEKQQHDEHSIKKKLSQLQKIVAIKQKNNRELGKKLYQIKRINPQSRNQIKMPSIEQLDITLQGMEADFARMQQTLIDYTDKVNDLQHKTRHKQHQIEQLHKKRRMLMAQQKNQQFYLQSTSPKKASMGKNNYRVIQSEEDEHFMYPKIVKSHLSNNMEVRSDVEEPHSSKSEQMQESKMQLTPSVKNLIEKYHNIIKKQGKW